MLTNNIIHLQDSKDINYPDYLAKLFPDDKKDLVRTITFQVTDNCCLNCSYCYQINKSNHKLSFDIAKGFIDDVLTNNERTKNYIDSYNTKGVVIEFIGGEPFLEIDLIDKITDYFINKLIKLNHPWATRYRISICSNGILYFEPKVQEYIKKNINNLSLSISIDGNKELHDSCRKFPDGSGSYDKAIEAVKHYKNFYGREIGSKMTIAPENVKYVYDAVINLIDLGYTNIHLNNTHEKGWKTSDATILYYELKKVADYIINNNLEDKVFLSIFYMNKGTGENKKNNWCGANETMLAINWTGKIFSCIRFMQDSLGPEVKEYSIGTVEKGIGITNSEKNKIFELKKLTYYSQSPQKCIDCTISDGCSWCPAYDYLETGSINKRVTYICEMHYACVLASLYYYNSIYRKYNIDLRNKFNVDEEKALAIIPLDEIKMIKELSS